MEIGQQLLILKENNVSSETYNLLLIVSDYFISYFIVDEVSKKLIKFDKNIFEKKIKEENISKKLKDILDKEFNSKIKFENIKVLHENDLFVITPNEFYNKKDERFFLQFNASLNSNDFICTDKIDYLKAKNTFVPFVNVNNLLIEYFGKVEYYHFNTELIKKYFNQFSDFSFFAYTDNQKLKILVTDHKNQNKLLFFNSFNITVNTDIIYYLLLVKQQINIAADQKIILISDSSSTKSLEKELNQFFDNIQFENYTKNNFINSL